MAAGAPIDGVAIFENTSGMPDTKPTLKLGHAEYSEAAIFADYQGDGDDQLDVVAHYPSGKTVVFRNTNNSFDDGTVVFDDADNSWTQRHYLHDLDGDGDAELFSAKGPWGNNRASLQLAKASGTDTLQVRWRSSADTMIHAFEFADVDGDGDEDVVASDYAHGGRVYVYANEDGVLAQVPSQSIAATGPVHESVLADIDLDGDLDLAVGGRDQAHIYENLTITTGYRSAANRARALINAPFVFQPSVFGGDEFPSADFLNTQLARSWLGDYDVDVTFYSKDYQVVQAPSDPGRYGAVVKITAEDGAQYTRFRTLYKSPTRFSFMFGGISGELAVPAAGVDEQIWRDQRRFTNDTVGNALGRDINRSHDMAILLAGLDETGARAGHSHATRQCGHEGSSMVAGAQTPAQRQWRAFRSADPGPGGRRWAEFARSAQR